MADETTTTETAQTDGAAGTGGEETSLLGGAAAANQEQQEGKANAEGQGKEQTEKDAKPGAPEKYEFKAPDGMDLDPEAVAAFEPLARELNLTQEAAQKLVDIYAGRMSAFNSAQQAQALQQRQGWEESVRSDKELGGHNLDATLAAGKQALNQFGTPELVNLLNHTGLGSNPEFVRFCAKVGKAMAEDSFHRGGSGADADDNSADARARRLLPKSYPNKG